MADLEAANPVYNAQLVGYLGSVLSLHSAEYGRQDAFSLYHRIQEQANRGASSIGGGPILPALGHAVAGSAATAVTKLLLYPLDLVITRMQVQKQLSGPREAPSAARDGDAEYENLLDAALKIYDSEGGFKAFYTGLGPDVVKGIGDSFLFFLAYNFLRQRETKKFGNTLPVHRELGIGVVAGALSKFVTTPLQNIITRQQTAALVTARDPTSVTFSGQSNKLTVKDIARQIRDERGLKGFWAGYSASVILTLNPAITFAVDNLLHSLMPSSELHKPGPQLTFLIAATSKAIATAITYPVSLAKSRAQVKTPTQRQEESEGGLDDEKRDVPIPRQLNNERLHSTENRHAITETLKKVLRLFSAQYAVFVSLRKIYQSEGLGGLYSGLEGDLLKGFLSHGLTMAMKDSAHVGVIQLYYALLKVTRKWPAELQKAQQKATHVVGDVKEGATHVVEGVKERAESVGANVAEGGRQVLGGEKKDY